jgi:hypothetical protein
MIDATRQERDEYASLFYGDGSPVAYPLAGWQDVDGTRCAVEALVDDADFSFELMAPIGMHFTDGPHSLLCIDAADVAERAASSRLEPCRGTFCGCLLGDRP